MAQTNILRVKLFLITTTKQSGLSAAKYPLEGLSGDHIVKVLPVPIPNTEVKLSEPMIVHTSVKVGIAGFLNSSVVFNGGVFLCARGMDLPLMNLECCSALMISTES